MVPVIFFSNAFSQMTAFIIRALKVRLLLALTTRGALLGLLLSALAPVENPRELLLGELQDLRGFEAELKGEDIDGPNGCSPKKGEVPSAA